MRRAFWLLLPAATAYLAVLYSAPALLVCAGAEVLILLLCGVTAICLRRRLRVRFPRETAQTDAGTDALCRAAVTVDTPLPAGRFALYLRLRYPQDRRARRQRVTGAAVRGEQTVTFRVHAPYCGPVTVQAVRLQVYDWLSVFSAGKKTAAVLRLSVLPRERALRFAAADPGSGGQAGAEAGPPVSGPAGADGELVRIREYLDGDPVRHIHWNLSARTDKLQLREYAPDPGELLHVVPEPAGLRTAAQADAFWTLLSALILGLLPHAGAVRVYRTENGVPIPEDVTDAEGWRALLPALYRAAAAARKEGRKRGPAPLPDPAAFRLTAEPALYRGKTLLRRFSRPLRDSEMDGEIRI